MASITLEEHKKIRRMRRGGMRYREIAELFNVSRERIRQILSIYGENGRIKLSTIHRKKLDNIEAGE